jgi:hypothetical protein
MLGLLLACLLMVAHNVVAYNVVAQSEVTAPRVQVIYSEPFLADYAQEVARDAEAALDILTQYFGEPQEPIAITINNNSDIFNAFGSPLPRPKVSVRTLFPNDALLGFGAKDELFLLLVHELTHVQQLTYIETEGTFAWPQLGIVGQKTAQVPPMWFLEGIAVWIESEVTEGGRRDDALTEGLLDTLVLSENFPTLTDVSLSSFGSWPGGNARYLLGVSFLQHLIDGHGTEAVLATLRIYNSSLMGDFASAWQRAAGSNLFTEWATWQEVLKAEAEQRTAGLPEQTKMTTTGWYTGAPALSPDGKKLAWVSSPAKIVVADVVEGALKNQRTVLDRRAPDTLEWLDDTTLLYSRVVRQPGTEYLELFSLNITTGAETQLTQGARAQFPNMLPDGCILFVRDLYQEGSGLRHYCDGSMTPFWQAPEGSHIVGLDVSEQGKVLLSLWREGQTDVGVLENSELTFLTNDAFQDFQASWQGDDEIIFSSNRSGRFELYSLNLTPASPLMQLTFSSGAALQATSKGAEVFYLTLGANGYDVAVTNEQFDVSLFAAPSPLTEPLELSRPTFGTDVVTSDQDTSAQAASDSSPLTLYASRPYSPWRSLLPYGWLPTKLNVSVSPFYVSLGASLYGLDDTLTHGYSLNASYNSYLRGHLGGLELYGIYDHNANTVYTQLLPPHPASFAVRFGVWEHSPHLASTTETALGFEMTYRVVYPLNRWTLRATLQGGLLHLQSYGKLQPDVSFGVSLSQQFSDDWGYRTRGPRFAVSSLASATPKGASFGAWLDASYFQPLSVFDVSGTLELALRGGYRPSRIVPLALEDWAVMGTMGYRVSLPVQWRVGDGRYALERVTLEPRLRPYFDGTFGLGADLTLSADTILGYGAPTTFGVTFGYAQNRVYWNFGLKLPL